MEKELDLFKFDDSFVAKIIAQGNYGATVVDKKGNIKTLWGGKN